MSLLSKDTCYLRPSPSQAIETSAKISKLPEAKDASEEITNIIDFSCIVPQCCGLSGSAARYGSPAFSKGASTAPKKTGDRSPIVANLYRYKLYLGLPGECSIECAPI